MIAEAVRSLARREPATINALALEIGIDQSGASRLVKDAVQAGYLEMRQSSADARQRHVEIGKAGKHLLKDAHRWQEKLFSELAADWTVEEQRAFHNSML